MTDRAEQTDRANFIGAPEFFDLNQACRVIVDAFGHGLYLVGSSTVRRDYRDVDLRFIMDDDDFDRLFPESSNGSGAPHLDAKWSLLCSSISLYLARHSGLKIDFQFQRRTQANAMFPKQIRHAMGLFYARKPVTP